MDIQSTDLGKSQYQLKITIEEKTKKEALQKTYEKIRKSLKIGGFRPGKVPLEIVKQHVSEATAIETMLDDYIPDWIALAVEEKKLLAVTIPTVEVEKIENEIVFTATFTVKPVIKIVDYKKINKKPTPPKITDKEVDKNLQEFADYYSNYEKTDKKLAKGFQGNFKISAKLDGETISAFERENHPLIIGDGYFAPGFDEAVEGMKTGQEKTFDLEFPQSYPIERFRQKKISFSVKLLEVKEKKIRELNDELAKEAGAYDLKNLKDIIKSNLQKKADYKAKKSFEQEIYDTLVDKSEFEVPEAYIKDEMTIIENEFLDQIAKRGLSEDQFLKIKNMKKEDLLKEWEPQAKKVAKLNLVLDNISEIENILPTPQDVEEEIGVILYPYSQGEKTYTTEGKKVKKWLKSERGRNYVATQLRRKLTQRFLLSNIEKGWPEASPEIEGQKKDEK